MLIFEIILTFLNTFAMSIFHRILSFWRPCRLNGIWSKVLVLLRQTNVRLLCLYVLLYRSLNDTVRQIRLCFVCLMLTHLPHKPTKLGLTLQHRFPLFLADRNVSPFCHFEVDGYSTVVEVFSNCSADEIVDLQDPFLII
jgi:hypothetical protein